MHCSSIEEIIRLMRIYKCTNRNAEFISCDNPAVLELGFCDSNTTDNGSNTWVIRLGQLKSSKFNSVNSRQFFCLVMTTENPEIKKNPKGIIWGDKIDFSSITEEQREILRYYFTEEYNKELLCDAVING